MESWISPTMAMDMVYDDPAGGNEDFGFALLRREAKGRPNSVFDLARAKLQPREPTTQEVKAATLPITTAAHRLVLAPGVGEADDIGAFFTGYDADTPRRLKLLAVLMTMRFDHDVMVHDMMSAVGSYAEMILARQHRLSSLVVCHRPGEGLSARAPHAHVLCLSRTHRPGGFAEQNALFKGDANNLHLNFMEEWRSFRTAWTRIASG
jgi:hypothetical protein